MNSIIAASPILAAVCYLVCAVEYSLLLRKSGMIFLIPFLYSALWSVPGLYQPLDFLHAALWSASFVLIVTRNLDLKSRSTRWYFIWSIPALCFAGAIASALGGKQLSSLHFYLYLIGCVGTLLVTEQMIRSSIGLVRTVGISVGALFLLNLYVYASSLITRSVSADLVQTRELANAAVALLIFLAPLSTPAADRPRKIGLSRPLVFTTTSLVLAGSILVGIAGLSYVLRLGEREHGAIIQYFLLFLFALSLGFYLSSSVQRARIKVWINKNFFQTKYDYNAEWRLLSERLSRPTGDNDYATTAVEAIASIYNGTGGACYLKEGRQYVPRQKPNANDNLRPIEISGAEGFFQRMLDYNWIFLRGVSDPNLSRYNELIPETLADPVDTLLILPLISNDTLIAFVTVYTDAQHIEDFDFEDLDLLRMINKQIASFVGYHKLYEERVVARQFEAFHQITTFVMHDLKNLIAQQALVVENAARFIDNPEFIADAIKTIENSVAKMNRLIRKINENTPIDSEQSQFQCVRLVDVIDEAISKCNGSRPRPELHVLDDDMFVEADPDTLVMAFTHLISNAQDACDSKDGKVDIFLSRESDRIQCRVIDNGIGMDDDFIENRLFKPFDSTKSTKGMGIGAYQYRQILSNIGGQISVESKVGEGSCFTVSLPSGVTAAQ